MAKDGKSDRKGRVEFKNKAGNTVSVAMPKVVKAVFVGGLKLRVPSFVEHRMDIAPGDQLSCQFDGKRLTLEHSVKDPARRRRLRQHYQGILAKKRAELKRKTRDRKRAKAAKKVTKVKPVKPQPKKTAEKAA